VTSKWKPNGWKKKNESTNGKRGGKKRVTIAARATSLFHRSFMTRKEKEREKSVRFDEACEWECDRSLLLVFVLYLLIPRRKTQMDVEERSSVPPQDASKLKQKKSRQL
jgi:hypothetical protein